MIFAPVKLLKVVLLPAHNLEASEDDVEFVRLHLFACTCICVYVYMCVHACTR